MSEDAGQVDYVAGRVDQGEWIMLQGE